jgi:hypothetical protein
MSPSTINSQPPLPLFQVAEDDANVEALVKLLRGKGWVTAAQILEQIGWVNTDDHRRWIRALAAGSAGRIGSGQKGYKIVEDMTHEEYHRCRNWMSHQAEEMQRRVVEMDRVWYARKPVHPGNGILTTDQHG